MNRAKALLVSLGLANSFFSTQLCTTNRLLSSQVTKFSSLFLFPSNHDYTSHLVNSHQNLLVSSSNFTSNSFSAYEWSTKFEPRMDPWTTSDFFNCECKQNGFRPNSSIYVLVLPTLAREESMVSFWIVLAKMKVEGFYINKEMYLGILAQLETKYLASEVVALANFYNSMVGFTAEKIVNLMKTAGYKPDNITYRQLIYGLCKARRLEEACIVLVEMEGNGCVPDSKLGPNCKFDADLINKTEDAYKLLINIVDITILKPLQVTHTNLIEKLLMLRKLEEFGTAEDAAESLKEFPSFSAYVHALKSFFPEGRYYEAKVLLSKGPYHIRQDHEICRLFSSTKCNVAAS
ncbi:hypothetical protein UlMin_042052 [Ulmus minor]